MAAVDSFFDIFYDLSLDSTGSPVVSAKDFVSGEVVPVVIDRTVRFNNADKGMMFRIEIRQRVGTSVEPLLVSGLCDALACVVTEVGPNRSGHRGHVTVLK